MQDHARARTTATSRPPRAAEGDESGTQLSERGTALLAQGIGGQPAPKTGISLDLVSLHLLRAIAKAAARGRSTDLEELALEIGVRKVDCRAALTTLHRQGYVDVLRMRPTLQGFALGASVRNAVLDPVRGAAVSATRAA